MLLAFRKMLLYRFNSIARPDIPPQRKLLLSTSSAATREAERAARRARREALAKKRSQVAAYVDSISVDMVSDMEEQTGSTVNKDLQNDGKETKAALVEERDVLLVEAKAMTRSLYRTCLRCVKVLRPGNEHDERQFREREEAEQNSSEDTLSFSMAPPVDRENELSSRAAYYYEFTRENFEQESDCLRHDMWRDEHVDRYLHFLRNGEAQRKWILSDYKFDDPYPDKFDAARVDRFESRAQQLLTKTYETLGWLRSSELNQEDFSNGRDDFFDEEDESGRGRPRH